MSHGKRGRLDPRKTRRELRRREREVGVRRQVDWGWVIAGVAVAAFLITFILLYINA